MEHSEKRIKQRNVKCWYAYGGLMVDQNDSRLGGLNSNKKSHIRLSFAFFIITIKAKHAVQTCVSTTVFKYPRTALLLRIDKN